MYKCERCGTVSPPGQKRLFIRHTRPKKYKDKYGDVIGAGQETEREENLCKRCLREAEKDADLETVEQR